jgi:hypothetical protein
MRRVPHPIAFFLLLAVQIACAQDIFWIGQPVYRALLHGHRDQVSAGEVRRVVTVMFLMQAAYWLAYHLRPRLRFDRHHILGHMLTFIGDVSFVFPTTVAAVSLFDTPIDLVRDWWRLLTLAIALFSMFCYKLQLQWFGEALLKGTSEE